MIEAVEEKLSQLDSLCIVTVKYLRLITTCSRLLLPVDVGVKSSAHLWLTEHLFQHLAFNLCQ